jgi:hypothetical protein
MIFNGHTLDTLATGNVTKINHTPNISVRATWFTSLFKSLTRSFIAIVCLPAIDGAQPSSPTVSDHKEM